MSTRATWNYSNTQPLNGYHRYEAQGEPPPEPPRPPEPPPPPPDSVQTPPDPDHDPEHPEEVS